MVGGRAGRSRSRSSNDTHVDEPHADESSANEDQTDVDIINEDDAGLQPKKKRGPTMAASLWSYTGAAKTVIYDNDGHPVGGDAKKLTTFLGCLARNGELFPITTPTWSTMNDSGMRRAWDEIQKRFITDHPNAKRKLMAIMNARWKDWKSYLKTHNFVPGDRTTSIANTSNNDRVNPTQWAALVDCWLSDDAQQIAKQNRENRQKLLVGHTLGTKSIPKKRHELFQKKGKEMDRADMYIESHTRSDNSILPGADSNMQKIIELKKVEEAGGSSSTQSTGRNDILTQVLGPERHGRLRQGGIGATATNTWGARNINKELERENQELRAELKIVRETAKKVDDLQTVVAELLKRVPVPSVDSNNQNRFVEEDQSGSNNLPRDL